MKELKTILENLEGAYPAFVDSVLRDRAEDGYTQEIKDYIANHPDANVGDVIRVSSAMNMLRDEYPDLVQMLLE